MDTQKATSILVNTQIAALLTGKTIRTINNWLESGVIKGSRVSMANLPAGVMWEINIDSLTPYIQLTLTDEIREYIIQADVKVHSNTKVNEATAMVIVGTYFYKAQIYKIAADWFEAAAKKGNIDAMELLATCYLKGVGVEKDPAMGVQWLGKAASLGHSIARVKVRELALMNEALERASDKQKAF
ncbi:MAG: tetratricopeptide repeat protein [Acidithiobacillus ferriphilus]